MDFKDKTDYSFEGQQKGEQIIFLLRQHPITQILAILAVFAIAILPFVFLFIDSLYLHFLTLLPLKTRFFLLFSWYLLVLGFAFERFLFWYFNVYILTNERIIDIDFFGVSSKRVSEARVSQVQDVSSDMSGPLRVFFHFGDVIIQTAAERPEFDFHAVPRCDLVAQRIGEECRIEEAEPPGVIA